MSVTFIKSKNYCLLNNKIILDIEDGLTINKLKNLNPNSFSFDSENEVWIYNNYKSSISLVKLLYPDEKIKSTDFKNEDVNDYRKDNILLTLDERFINKFNVPNGYQVLNTGQSYKVSEGKFAGQYRNMYWKVKDNENETYYLIHIKDDIYTKISKRDINKVLNYDNVRPSWYINSNGYVGSTIRINNNVNQIYLHQLIMDVHNEDLTSFEKTVDHINHDKLDNRRQNLRLVNMSVQNSNRDKAERRVDACELPIGIEQKDLPKYVVYRKEFLDKEKNKFREYFYICNHPKLEKNWDTTKSNEISIKEKLRLVKLKLQELEEIITEKQYQKETGQDKQIDMPPYIRLTNTRNKMHLVFDKKDNGDRLGYTMVLKSTDIQKELNNFIEQVNKKYPELVMSKYQIKNIGKIKEKDVSNEENKKSNTDIKLKLPANFSFFRETNGGYQFGFSKSIEGEKLCSKLKIKSNDIQIEFNNFVNIVNNKFPQLKINQYQIPNIPNDFKIIKSNEQLKTDSSTNFQLVVEPTNNINISKPVMPQNFSICSVNQVDYIQFNKKIDEKRFQYKTKINSYDLQIELENFIDQLNEKYDIGLIKSEYKIINTNGWKTTNKIIEHDDTDKKIAQRLRTLQNIEKKKQEIGIEEFRKQKALYAKKYRESKKEIEV
jgi:hypothetical protein